MISKFHVLYVGQIELDNIGLNGTPANDRRYSDERLREVFATVKDVAQTMDELNFDVLWMAEHHFQREGYEVIPNLIQTGLWLATQTKKLKFGCAFNVLPMWHPIRMAEDYAMADIVTDGRVIMGVGRGYHTREVETLRRAADRRREEPRLLRGAVAASADLLQRAGIQIQGQVLRMPAGGGVPRLYVEGHHAGPAAEEPAGGNLDADRQRQDHRHDGALRTEGHGHAERREDPRRRGARLS